MASGLQLDYVVALAPVIAELRYPLSNNQRAMVIFIGPGHYRCHLRRLAAALTERATVDDALPDHLPGLTIRRDAGVASVWITGQESFNERRLVEAARNEGVLIEPGDVFFADPERRPRCFRHGFSSTRTERIEEELRRLGRLLR